MHRGLLGPDDVDLPDILGRDRDWRSVSWARSLRLSGQCAYAAVIPPGALRISRMGKSGFHPLTGVDAGAGHL